MLIPKRCDVCDKELLLGSARYDVDIRVASSFDGYLPELDEVDATEESREDKLAKLGETPLLAPVVIAVGLHRQVSAQIPELEEIEAVACAVQNMHLTASALGMAAFWSTPPVTYTREMADWLGWTGAGDRCLGLFYLGWPADETWPDSPRRPMADKVVWRNSAE